MTYVQEPHTSMFSGPTNSGKTKKVLNLIEQEYRDHFENIIIYVLRSVGMKHIEPPPGLEVMMGYSFLSPKISFLSGLDFYLNYSQVR